MYGAIIEMDVPGDDSFLARVQRFIRKFMNPTKTWTRNPNLDLILDLDKNTLNGIGLGEPLSALSFLGPADEYSPVRTFSVDDEWRKCGKSKKSYNVDYHVDGVGITTDKRFILGRFSISLQPDRDTPASRAYSGKIVFNGQTMGTAAIGTVSSLLRILGSPDQDQEIPADDNLEFENPPYSRYLQYDRPVATWIIFVDRKANTHSISIFVSNAATTPQTVDTR